MFEFGEEAFDAPALLVGDAVVGALDLAVSAGWNDGLSALFEDEIAQAIGVIGSVGQHLSCRQAPDEIAGGSHVVLLSGAEHETHRQAERIDYDMDLGAEPASGAAESLGFSAPLFILAPAAWA